MGEENEIKIPLDPEYAEFDIVRDGKTFALTPDELEIAGYAAEYRWLAKELEFRLSDPVWYGLERQAGLILDGSRCFSRKLLERLLGRMPQRKRRRVHCQRR